MRIAYLVHDLDCTKGQGRYVYELCRRFSGSHEVHVFSNTFEARDVPEVRWHPVWAWRRASLSTVLSFYAATMRLDLRGFDVVHAQGLCGPRQDVLTAHICSASRLEALARTAALPIGLRIWRRLVLPLERRALQPSLSPRVIAVSSQVAADLARHYGRHHAVAVIRHGVDTERFHPATPAERLSARARFQVPADAIVALYVGELLKGARVALQAVASVPDLELVFVSGSPVGPFERCAQELGVQHRVRFLPAVPDVEHAYRMADLFLFPSSYDSFGMVVTEAMASGLPVITSAAVGASELLEDGVSGVVVRDPADAEAFAAALSRLVRAPHLRRQHGLAARSRVSSLTWDSVALQTMEVYESLLSTSTRALDFRTDAHASSS